MRIAVVHSFYASTEPSGENLSVTAQVAALRRAGHEVLEVFTSTTKLKQEVKFYDGRAALRTVTGTGRNPKAVLKNFSPDITHIHNLFPNWSTRWLSDWPGRTVATLHNYRAVCSAATLTRDGKPCNACLTSPVLPAIRHKCYKGSRVKTMPLAIATRPGGAARTVADSCSALITLSVEMSNFYRSVLQLSSTVIPNFSVSREYVAQKPDRSMPWIFAGRITPEKGLPWLLQRWPSDAQLHIYGAGPEEQTVQRSLTDRPNIVFRGQVSNSEVQMALGSAQGVVIPSLWKEGIPTIMLEALASGRPLILGSSMSVAKQMQCCGAAEIVHPDISSTDLASIIRSLEANWEHASEHARATHESLYSESAWVRSIVALYSRVIANG